MTIITDYILKLLSLHFFKTKINDTMQKVNTYYKITQEQ